MRTFLFIVLLFVPLFDAERYPADAESNEDMFMPRANAASYLCKDFFCSPFVLLSFFGRF